MLDVATDLLETHGYHQFSIVEVSKKSKISIGSIYGRVTSKDDLVRSVQERALGRVDLEYERFWTEIASENLSLEPLFRRYVQYFSGFLNEYAALFHAFISRASVDPVIRARGKSSHRLFTKLFAQSLLKHRQEITHPDPERAVLACSRLLWSSFASFLGIDSDESAGNGNFVELTEDVTEMGLYFLTAPQRINGRIPNSTAVRKAAKTPSISRPRARSTAKSRG